MERGRDEGGNSSQRGAGRGRGQAPRDRPDADCTGLRGPPWPTQCLSASPYPHAHAGTPLCPPLGPAELACRALGTAREAQGGGLMSSAASGPEKGVRDLRQSLGSGQWCEGTEVTRPSPPGWEPGGIWGLEEGFGGQVGREGWGWHSGAVRAEIGSQEAGEGTGDSRPRGPGPLTRLHQREADAAQPQAERGAGRPGVHGGGSGRPARGGAGGRGSGARQPLAPAIPPAARPARPPRAAPCRLHVGSADSDSRAAAAAAAAAAASTSGARGAGRPSCGETRGAG